jgi:hypothetical protein
VALSLLVNPPQAAQIVLGELAVGLSYCQLVRVRRESLNQDRPTNVERARMSLGIAEQMMWKLKPTHPQFNEIMARTERLRLGFKASVLSPCKLAPFFHFDTVLIVCTPTM